MYLFLLKASAIFVQTDRDDLLAWSVKEYLSSGGNLFEI